MKKNILILFLVVCFMTGCSNTPELSYSGNDLLYTCTDSDIVLFKDDVNVIITDKQSFVYFDDDLNMREFTDGLLEFNEDNRVNITKCYFVKKDEVINNEFSSDSNIAFKDKVEGSINLKLSGTYSFKIVNSKTFIDNYSSNENLMNGISTQINATFIANMSSKTFAELSSEKEFNSNKINSLNNVLNEKYGIEIIKVNTNLEKK